MNRIEKIAIVLAFVFVLSPFLIRTYSIFGGNKTVKAKPDILSEILFKAGIKRETGKLYELIMLSDDKFQLKITNREGLK